LEFFHCHNPPDRTIVLGSIPEGKGGRCVRLTTYHHPEPLSRNLGNLTPWKPLPPPPGSVTGLIYLLVAKSTTGYDFDPVPIASQFFIIYHPTKFAIFRENIFLVSEFQIVKDDV